MTKKIVTCMAALVIAVWVGVGMSACQGALSVSSSTADRATLTVVLNRPVRWTFNAGTTEEMGCMTGIKTHTLLGINGTTTVNGETAIMFTASRANIIKFTPTRKGTFTIKCQMGMDFCTVVVVEG